MQLICLSATVANPDELAGWIGQVLLLLLACHTVFVLVIYIRTSFSEVLEIFYRFNLFTNLDVCFKSRT